MGKVFECDRCKFTMTLKQLDNGQLEGGQTGVDQYEDPSNKFGDWLCIAGKDLCPFCADSYSELLGRFFNCEI